MSFPRSPRWRWATGPMSKPMSSWKPSRGSTSARIAATFTWWACWGCCIGMATIRLSPNRSSSRWKSACSTSSIGRTSRAAMRCGFGRRITRSCFTRARFWPVNSIRIASLRTPARRVNGIGKKANGWRSPGCASEARAGSANGTRTAILKRICWRFRTWPIWPKASPCMIWPRSSWTRCS